MFYLLLIAQLWTSSPDPSTILSGNWQSCADSHGEYVGFGERIVDHYVNGKFKWEFHMGPEDEFALFNTQHEFETGDAHSGKDNLLGPVFRVNDANGYRSSRQWNVPKLNLWISIVRAGESDNREVCYSYFVLVKKLR